MSMETNPEQEQGQHRKPAGRFRRLKWNPLLPLIHLAILFPVCAVRGFTFFNVIGLAVLVIWLLLAIINPVAPGGWVRNLKDD